MTRTRTRGFTLIELMIVLVVIAVLAAIALPSYQSYVIRANRAQVQQFMQDIANREEQFRLDARAYTTALTGANTLNMGGVPTDIQANYGTPVVTLTGNDCASTAMVAPAYKIVATPVGGSPNAGDGALCLDSMGNKTPTNKWQR